MEAKTNWGRIFGGILLLAVLYLIWRALNVGKDATYGEVKNVMKPDAYQANSLATGSDLETGDVVVSGEVDVIIENDVIVEVDDNTVPSGERP